MINGKKPGEHHCTFPKPTTLMMTVFMAAVHLYACLKACEGVFSWSWFATSRQDATSVLREVMFFSLSGTC